MKTDETTAKQWIDGYSDTLVDIFKTGKGVTVEGLGGFYVARKSYGTAFKFNPSQKIRFVLGWSSTYKDK